MSNKVISFIFIVILLQIFTYKSSLKIRTLINSFKKKVINNNKKKRCKKNRIHIYQKKNSIWLKHFKKKKIINSNPVYFHLKDFLKISEKSI